VGAIDWHIGHFVRHGQVRPVRPSYAEQIRADMVAPSPVTTSGVRWWEAAGISSCILHLSAENPLLHLGGQHFVTACQAIGRAIEGKTLCRYICKDKVTVLRMVTPLSARLQLACAHQEGQGVSRPLTMGEFCLNYKTSRRLYTDADWRWIAQVTSESTGKASKADESVWPFYLSLLCQMSVAKIDCWRGYAALLELDADLVTQGVIGIEVQVLDLQSVPADMAAKGYSVLILNVGPLGLAR
jgi:hypothetical protein